MARYRKSPPNGATRQAFLDQMRTQLETLPQMTNEQIAQAIASLRFHAIAYEGKSREQLIVSLALEHAERIARS